jgi:chromosome segregation ATPase
MQLPTEMLITSLKKYARLITIKRDFGRWCMGFRIGMIVLALALGAVSCGPSPQEQALTQSVAELQRQINDYTTNLEAARAQLATVSEELTTTQQALTEVNQSQEHVATLQSERDALREELEGLQTQLTEAQNERDQLSEDLETSNEEVASLERSVTERADITPGALTELQETLEQTSQERDELLEQVSETTETTSTLQENSEATRNQLGLLEQEVLRLTNELKEARLAAINTELNAVTASAAADLESERQALAEEVERLTAELEAARTDTQDQTDLQTQLTELQEQLGQVTQERDDLNSFVATSTREVASLKQQLEEAEVADLEELQGQVSELTRERDGLRAELRQRDEEIAELQETPQIALETMTSERDTLLTRVSALQDDLQDSQAERDDLTAQISTLTSQINLLNASLETARQERDDLQTQLTTLQGQLEGAAENEEPGSRTLASTDTPREEAEVAGGSSASATPDTTLSTAYANASELNGNYEAILSQTRGLSTLTPEQQNQLEETRVAFVEAQREVARLTGARGIHTVVSGENLSVIADSFYDQGSEWPRLLEANRHLLGNNPSVLYEGIVLVIPQ